MITPGLIEECRGIIRRWIAAGRIKVAAPLHPGIDKSHLTYRRSTRPLSMERHAVSMRKLRERRFSL